MTHLESGGPVADTCGAANRVATLTHLEPVTTVLSLSLGSEAA